MARKTTNTWRWTRRIPAAREGAWHQLLESLGLSPVIHARPRARLVELEAYAPSAALLRTLASECGGKVERVNVEKILRDAAAPRRPVVIARNLGVIDAHGSWPRNKPRPGIVLRIAGAMAFGTGEHATTAACLKFLNSESRSMPRGWRFLDIGTGSGILAIAAEKLGAAHADAFDYDTRALEAAKANAARNRCGRVVFANADLLRWKPRRRYPMVVANVFSDVLKAAASQIARAVAPGGTLVISGILRAQEDESVRAFIRRNLVPAATVRRGKWCTVMLRCGD